MQEVQESGETIVDVSDTETLHPNFIDWFEKNGRGFYRFSKPQVQAIVRQVYVPWQVQQYNTWAREHNEQYSKYPNFQVDGWDLDSRQAEAMRDVADAYDAYVSIPAGAYYGRQYELPEALTLEQLERHGSPCRFISRKRFSGFVTRSVEYTIGGIFEFPDREIAMGWDLEGQPQVCPWRKTGFSRQDAHTVSLEATLRSDAGRWEALYRTLAPEKARMKIDQQRQWSADLWNGKTEEERYETLVAQYAQAPTLFWINLDRAAARKLGFIPFTRYYQIRTIDDVIGFATRWLGFTEGGISFYRPYTGVYGETLADNMDTRNGFDLKGFAEHLRAHTTLPADGRILDAHLEDWARSTGFSKEEPRKRH